MSHHAAPPQLSPILHDFNGPTPAHHISSHLTMFIVTLDHNLTHLVKTTHSSPYIQHFNTIPFSPHHHITRHHIFTVSYQNITFHNGTWRRNRVDFEYLYHFSSCKINALTYCEKTLILFLQWHVLHQLYDWTFLNFFPINFRLASSQWHNSVLISSSDAKQSQGDLAELNIHHGEKKATLDTCSLLCKWSVIG